MARAAGRLYDGTASAQGRGLLPRGQLEAGITRAAVGQVGALSVAANGLVRLSRVAEQAAERLLDHPEPAVRRAAALLAAAAYPLLTGLEATPGVPAARTSNTGILAEGEAAPAAATRAAAGSGIERPRLLARPDDLDWLSELVGRSPVVANARRRAHWQTLLPWLDTGERYALAAALLDVAQHLGEAGDR